MYRCSSHGTDGVIGFHTVTRNTMRQADIAAPLTGLVSRKSAFHILKPPTYSRSKWQRRIHQMNCTEHHVEVLVVTIYKCLSHAVLEMRLTN